MKLKNTLGLTIVGLIKAYIVRPVIEIDNCLIVVGGFFVKGMAPETLNKDLRDYLVGYNEYYYNPSIVLNLGSRRLNRSILDSIQENYHLSKIRNLDRWLPDGRYMLMQLKVSWDNRNLGLSFNARGIPVKVFPKPVYIQGWV